MLRKKIVSAVAACAMAVSGLAVGAVSASAASEPLTIDFHDSAEKPIADIPFSIQKVGEYQIGDYKFHDPYTALAEGRDIYVGEDVPVLAGLFADYDIANNVPPVYSSKTNEEGLIVVPDTLEQGIYVIYSTPVVIGNYEYKSSPLLITYPVDHYVNPKPQITLIETPPSDNPPSQTPPDDEDKNTNTTTPPPSTDKDTKIPPILDVVKSADRSQAQVGNTIHYAIRVNEIVAPPAESSKNTVMTDSLPDGEEYVEGSLKTSVGTARYSNGVITADLGELPYGVDAYIEYDVLVVVNDNTVLKNTASAKSDNANEVSDDADVVITFDDSGLADELINQKNKGGSNGGTNGNGSMDITELFQTGEGYVIIGIGSVIVLAAIAIVIFAVKRRRDK